VTVRGRQIVFPERGRVEVEDFDVPAPGPGQIVVRSEVSLISAGTELTTLLGENPRAAFPAHPGYSNVGLVDAVGAGVTACRAGDRVLTLGKHASHVVVDLSPDRPGGAQYVEKVPDGTAPADASFAILGSVAMHGVRKGEPRLGQSAVVIGQGVVGQLVAQLARLGGCAPVIGVDAIPQRLEKARLSGTPIVVNAAESDVAAAVREATAGLGAELGFDATRNPNTILTLMEVAAQSGRIVIVGSIPGKVELSLYDHWQMKELMIVGAHQPKAPLVGHPTYPWTQGRNRRVFLDLLRDGAARVDHLITHRLPVDEAPAAYEMIRRGGDDWLGVLFRWS
jgi:2-desacetyl-2-hydroxyethyl bacteriochlorophyllide A dehydrogenase